MKSKLSILVTGGAGYLGSVLVPELLKLGHFVKVIDNFMYGQNSLSMCCGHSNFEIIVGDVRDRTLVHKHIEDVDVVIPLAGLVGAPICEKDPAGARLTNVSAIAIICRKLRSEQRILIPTSNSGYGITGGDDPCTEEMSLVPISVYGKTKVIAEAIAMDHGNTISFRFATLFGMSPRMRLDLLVNDFVYRAVHDRSVVLFESHFKRNYLHVRDAVRVFIRALCFRDNLCKWNEIYNVGLSNANLSKLQLCGAIKKHVPTFVYMESAIGHDPDQRNYIVSNAKIEALGFRPQHSLDAGIRELVKGCKMLRSNTYGNI